MTNAPSYFIVDKDTGFVFYNNPFCSDNWCFVNPSFVPEPFEYKNVYYAPPIFTTDSAIDTISMLKSEGYSVDLKEMGEFENIA